MKIPHRQRALRQVTRILHLENRNALKSNRTCQAHPALLAMAATVDFSFADGNVLLHRFFGRSLGFYGSKTSFPEERII